MIPRRALILSAGRGERLRPFTNEVPKTMLALGGRPLLEHHVVLLREHGIREIAINLHYRPYVVIDHFRDGRAWGVSIRYSMEPTLLGTAGAAKSLEPFLGDGTFVVLYGDNVLAGDLTPLFEHHARSGACATLAVVEGPDPTAGGIVAVADDGRVTRFLEKPRPEDVFSPLVSAGLYVMEPSVLRHIPPDRPSDFGHDVLPALVAAGDPVHAVRFEGELAGIDTPALYRKAQRDSGCRGGAPAPGALGPPRGLRR